MSPTDGDDISYEIVIHCPQCQRSVYERYGIGGDEYARLIEEARDALHNRLAQEHPEHGLTLDAKTKVLGI